jgi:hypothetical protein
LKKIGPLLEALIQMAIAQRIGNETIIPKEEAIRSKNLFIMFGRMENWLIGEMGKFPFSHLQPPNSPFLYSQFQNVPSQALKKGLATIFLKKRAW